jgi:erythromycin esterase-like protein
LPIDQLQLRGIREHSHPVTGSEADYAPIMDLIGNSRFVLIGGASHGTHEFYHTRAEITKHLIQKKGEVNLGQICRERYGSSTELIGFTTYTGSVTAASNWDGPAEQERVRPALGESFEALFHETYIPEFLLILGENKFLSGILNQERLERAIGVLYLPQSERVSHYFGARVADQFDAVIHLDETRALQPLEITSEWETGEVPETYPHAV